MRTTDVCPILESIGHPDPFGFRAPARCRGEPVRTAFHDAVARFGGQPGLLRRAFSSHGALRRRQPPLTSLSRPEQHAGSSERPRAHSLRQDRLTTHFVKDAPLPRPETPSPFRGTNRLVLAGDATRYVIRSLLRVLDPRTRFWLGAVSRFSRAMLSSSCEEPLHNVGEVHLPRIGGLLASTSDVRVTPLFRVEIVRASAGSERVEDARARL
jgi:hypothetical protein